MGMNQGITLLLVTYVAINLEFEIPPTLDQLLEHADKTIRMAHARGESKWQ